MNETPLPPDHERPPDLPPGFFKVTKPHEIKAASDYKDANLVGKSFGFAKKWMGRAGRFAQGSDLQPFQQRVMSPGLIAERGYAIPPETWTGKTYSALDAFSEDPKGTLKNAKDRTGAAIHKPLEKIGKYMGDELKRDKLILAEGHYGKESHGHDEEPKINRARWFWRKLRGNKNQTEPHGD